MRTSNFYKYALRYKYGHKTFGGFDTLKEARKAATEVRKEGSDIIIVRLDEYSGKIIRNLQT